MNTYIHEIVRFRIFNLFTTAQEANVLDVCEHTEKYKATAREKEKRVKTEINLVLRLEFN